ncbi:hypothetical protein ILUMI_16758 [Ignelater luminosus]|uniref:Uncharacterized protein n=1 Tax=Ignelater luminosus TaxID=2038154 RepID=A0A8K0CLB5_IGNLU|nr:hypothetical protein ILUMI_16758 [Ignelater luminosus]
MVSWRQFCLRMSHVLQESFMGGMMKILTKGIIENVLIATSKIERPVLFGVFANYTTELIGRHTFRSTSSNGFLYLTVLVRNHLNEDLASDENCGDKKIVRPSNLSASQLAASSETHFNHPRENDDDLVSDFDSEDEIPLARLITKNASHYCLKRYSYKKRKPIQIEQPHIINMYNKNMGGVNRCEENTSLYKTNPAIMKT